MAKWLDRLVYLALVLAAVTLVVGYVGVLQAKTTPPVFEDEHTKILRAVYLMEVQGVCWIVVQEGGTLTATRTKCPDSI